MRFSEQARQAIVLAQDEARRLGLNYVGAEHILLGLAAEKNGVATRVLGQLGMSVEALRTEIVRIFGRGDEAEGSGWIPLTPRAKHVFKLAEHEAKGPGVETEDILIALAIDGAGPAAVILTNHEADLERIREEISTIRRGRER